MSRIERVAHMGVHWYARSRELLDVAKLSAGIESRIVEPGATPCEIDDALDEREALFALEAEVRAELERRGASVSFALARAWPAHVRAHLDALRPSHLDEPILDRLGWGADYYAENLRAAGIPMEGFAYRLEYLSLSPHDARSLGEDLLQYASSEHTEGMVRAARVAGLWLYLWGSLDCFIYSSE